MTRLEITAGLLLILATILIILFVGVNDLAVGLDQRTQAQHARSIENGAALYEARCSLCHGTYGEGRTGPTLNTPVLFGTGPDGRISQMDWTGSVESYVKSAISAGRPGTVMQPWSEEIGGPLRDDEIQDITNFILNWESTAGQLPESVVKVEETPIPESQLVTVGGELFKSEGCTSCHTIEGVSQGQVGPDLTHIGTVAVERIAEAGDESAEVYIRQSIVDPNAYIAPACPQGPCPASVMPQSFGQVLSEERIKALVTYLLDQK
ncbi:MAG: c-type cytochrome [Anaerolineae bacterium]